MATSGKNSILQAVVNQEWPPHLLAFRIDDDCMEPSLSKEDHIIVDTTDLEIREGIYVIQVDNVLLARRLQPLSGRKVMVISDNPTYDNYEIDASFFTCGNLIGRVNRHWFPRHS